MEAAQGLEAVTDIWGFKESECEACQRCGMFVPMIMSKYHRCLGTDTTKRPVNISPEAWHARGHLLLSGIGAAVGVTKPRKDSVDQLIYDLKDAVHDLENKNTELRGALYDTRYLNRVLSFAVCAVTVVAVLILWFR